MEGVAGIKMGIPVDSRTFDNSNQTRVLVAQPIFIFGKIHREDLELPSAYWKPILSSDSIRLVSRRSRIVLRKLAYPCVFLIKSPRYTLAGYTCESWESAPTTTSNQLTDVEVLKFKRTFLSDDGCFLALEIDSVRGKLTILTDKFVTLPAYYALNCNCMILATYFMEIVPHVSRPIALNGSAIVDFLLSREPRRPTETVLSDIHVIPADSRLEYRSDGRIAVRQGRGFDVAPSKALSKREAVAQFVKVLHRVVRRQVKRLGNLSIAGELSGGLDSAIVNHAVKHVGGALDTVFSVVLPQPKFIGQKRRLNDLSALLETRLRLVDSSKILPFIDYPAENESLPFFPMEEIYREMVGIIGSLACQENIHVIFTGMGGDELLLGYFRIRNGRMAENPSQRRTIASVPEYYRTPTFKCLLRLQSDTIDAAPLLSPSVIGSNRARNHLYVRKGIWPISPLSDPELIRFCASKLGYSLVKNKLLFRLYGQAFGFPRTLAGLNTRDTFADVFALGMKSRKRRLLTRLFRNSRLSKMGLVDKKALLRDYNAFCNSSVNNVRAIHFYNMSVLEIFLRDLDRYGYNLATTGSREEVRPK